MKHSDMTDEPPKPQREEGEPEDPAAFDLWLRRGLHKLYSDVASEPLPAEWLKLIEEHRKA